MKKYKKVFCGISGKLNDSGKYEFSVDFDQNTDNDIIKFIEPFNVEKQMAGVEICWFGYQYNPDIRGEYKQQGIKFLENVKGTPVEIDDDSDEVYMPSNADNTGIRDEDLGIMIDRSLRNMKLNDYLIDTIIYPISQSNNLNHYIVKYVRQYLLNSDRLSYYELIKADPKNIQFDIDRCLSDVDAGDIPNYFKDSNGNKQLITEDALNTLINDARSASTFSLYKITRSAYMRKYFSNYLLFKNVNQNLHNAENVLIVDDNNTTGTTVAEVVRRIREYNDTCTIYVFTLTGSK
ncbi:MAG: phosphoribosyltransferase [Bacteroidales bacterium]|nr:phosphoribosyltransferase [Bacteroidales bacterium]